MNVLVFAQDITWSHAIFWITSKVRIVWQIQYHLCKFYQKPLRNALDDVVSSTAKQVLLKEEKVKMWFQHLEVVEANQRTGAKKAVAKRERITTQKKTMKNLGIRTTMCVINVTISTHQALKMSWTVVISLVLSGWHAARVRYGTIHNVSQFQRFLTFSCVRVATNKLKLVSYSTLQLLLITSC